MTVPTTSFKNIETLYDYPSSPRYWTAHIGTVDFMVPKAMLNQGEDLLEKISAGYLAWRQLFDVAEHFLTAQGGWRNFGVESPTWTPLWLEAIQDKSQVIFEAGLELVGDDYGNWKVTIIEGRAIKGFRVDA